jgi:hypothetical protein
MSNRTCNACGNAWAADFNFCPKDGSPLIAVAAADIQKAEPTVAGQRRLQRKPSGTWAFGTTQKAPEAPEVRIAEKAPRGRAPAEVAPVELRLVTPLPASRPEPVLARAPATPEPKKRASDFELPDFDFPDRLSAKTNIEPPKKSKRAPAEPPRVAPVVEVPAPVAAQTKAPEPTPAKPAKPAAEVAARPAIETPDTRSRKRPIAGPKRASADLVRELAQLRPEPVREADVPRSEETVPVFVEKKQRSAAAFSETAWFKRPLAAGQVDPETGSVSVTGDTYRRDPKVTPTQRRRFSLRRTGEEAV